jgi:hypothetical protein
MAERRVPAGTHAILRFVRQAVIVWIIMRMLSTLLFGLAAVAASQVIRFEDGVVGKLPAGWTVAMTHEGAQPRWEVFRDPEAPSPPLVLAQLSNDSTAGRFPMAIWERERLRDGEVSVRFKPVAGVVDQAAGLVWRYQDPNNYYVARANALEQNVAAYKVESGTRVSIPPRNMPSRSYGVKFNVQSGRWQKLRVVFHDSFFVIYCNEQRLFEIEDHSFALAGKTGLWTKADSQILFDDFLVARTDKRN